MRALTRSAFALFVLVATASAQAPPPDFEKAREARTAAQRAGNEQEWGRYTTDDFTVVGPTGTVQTKADRMAAIKGNKLAAPPPPQSDRKLRVYGDTVIETFVLDGDAGPTRFTSVWVKQSGTWKVASVHQTLITKKP
jgi:hypothetical protein